MITREEEVGILEQSVITASLLSSENFTFSIYDFAEIFYISLNGNYYINIYPSKNDYVLVFDSTDSFRDFQKTSFYCAGKTKRTIHTEDFNFIYGLLCEMAMVVSNRSIKHIS